MNHRRQPAVAGMFYEADAAALRSELEGYLTADTDPVEAVAVVCPHAGTVYSGPTAGRTFARVCAPEIAVVVGVNHRDPGASPLALYDAGTWTTPLGDVDVDEDFARAWLTGCPAIVADPGAHAREHSLEVQIPFLQLRNPAVRIVPLMVTTHDPATLRSAGTALGETVRDCAGGVLIVASTDMTHFESADRAETKDRMAIDAMLALDPDALMDTVARRRISMCGVAPTALVLHAAVCLGASQAELVDYRTSADTTGDRSDVVGYAGVVIR